MRHCHILKPNKAKRKPTRHLFVDIETEQIKLEDGKTLQRMKLGWLVFWRRRKDRNKDQITWHKFTQIDEFWDLVMKYVKRNEPLHLIAHNVNFDFGVLRIFDELGKRGFMLDNIYLGNYTTIATFTRNQEKIILLDNGNFFPGTLESLGRAINYEKLKIDFESADEEELSIYCRRDTDIMLKAWQYLYEFIETHDLGNVGRTLASQAFNAYRHRFMKKTIYIHNNPNAIALERESYHGGRTSVFYKGTLQGSTFYKLDINSMYPYVMYINPAPTKLYRYTAHYSIPELRKAVEKYCIIAECTVETDEPVYPILYNGHLIHPIGEFRTVLCTPEIEYALSKGHLKAVHRTALYEKDYIFREYVEYFYKLKIKYTEEGNTTFRTITKLFLNSLYGKFGQKAHKWEKLDDPLLNSLELDYIFDAKTGKKKKVYRFGNEYWTTEETGEAFNSFPAIASHVCAYARMYLWQLILKAGRENVYYCDTDSIITNEIGKKRLEEYIDETELGKLKIEETATKITILAPKVYEIGGHWKRKGVPSKAEYLGENTWKYMEFPSFRTQAHWKPGTEYYTQEATKTLSFKLYDGVETDSGWVKPIEYWTLKQEEKLDEKTLQKIAELEIQRGLLEESLTIPWRVIFRLYDFRKGTWKRARDKNGNLVPIEYSNVDSMATEFGFSTLDSFLQKILEEIEIRQEIAEINRKIYILKHPAAESPEKEEMPW